MEGHLHLHLEINTVYHFWFKSSYSCVGFGTESQISLPLSTTMGDYKKNTPQYDRKLEQSRNAKQIKSDAKLAKSSKGKRLMKSTRVKFITKFKEVQKRNRNSEKELEQKTMKANKYYRQLGPLSAKNAALEKEVAKLKSKLLGAEAAKKEKFAEAQALKKERAGLNRRFSAATQELHNWKDFWCNVEAHARPQTLKFLERLWANGAPRSRDSGWGGGQ